MKTFTLKTSSLSSLSFLSFLNSGYLPKLANKLAYFIFRIRIYLLHKIRYLLNFCLKKFLKAIYYIKNYYILLMDSIVNKLFYGNIITRIKKSFIIFCVAITIHWFFPYLCIKYIYYIFFLLTISHKSNYKPIIIFKHIVICFLLSCIIHIIILPAGILLTKQLVSVDSTGFELLLKKFLDDYIVYIGTPEGNSGVYGFANWDGGGGGNPNPDPNTNPIIWQDNNDYDYNYNYQVHFHEAPFHMFPKGLALPWLAEYLTTGINHFVSITRDSNGFISGSVEITFRDIINNHPHINGRQARSAISEMLANSICDNRAILNQLGFKERMSRLLNTNITPEYIGYLWTNHGLARSVILDSMNIDINKVPNTTQEVGFIIMKVLYTCSAGYDRYVSLLMPLLQNDVYYTVVKIFIESKNIINIDFNVDIYITEKMNRILLDKDGALRLIAQNSPILREVYNPMNNTTLGEGPINSPILRRVYNPSRFIPGTRRNPFTVDD